MNLDDLISKYLDGELTEKEDELLWASMTSDLNSNECETARFKFDSAVSLQLAMKEDALSIYPPEKLIAETEDMILMRIFSNAPEGKIHQRRRTLIWSTFPLMAAMIAFFMFIFVFEISDLSFNNNTTFSDKLQTISENKLTTDNKLFVSKSNRNNIKIKSNRNENKTNIKIDKNEIAEWLATNSSPSNFYSNYLLFEINTAESETNNYMTSQDNSTIKESEYETFGGVIPATNPELSFDRADFINAKLSNDLSNQNIYKGINNRVNPNYLLLQPNVITDENSIRDVEVSSLYGSDFVNGDLSVRNISISHFSQSIAYAINQEERFGVELGLSRYTYTDKGVVNVEHKIGGISGVESYEGGYDFSIGYPQEISINTDKQLLWGTIFYENSFIKVSDFALTSRLALGGSSEGAMGYGRLYAEYLIFNGFKITLGTEGRIFKANFSNFSKDDNPLKYSAALLYGIEFKF